MCGGVEVLEVDRKAMLVDRKVGMGQAFEVDREVRMGQALGENRKGDTLPQLRKKYFASKDVLIPYAYGTEHFVSVILHITVGQINNYTIYEITIPPGRLDFFSSNTIRP